jgi:hypothetical protein
MPLTLADFIDETPGVTLDDIPDEEEERINQTLEDLTQGLGEEPGGGPVSADVLVSKALNDRPGFETIQDALDGTNPVNGASGAEAGDTIRIESGEFNEIVSVAKQGISLAGAGEDQTTIAGQIDVTATGFTLQGTTVRANVDVTDDTAVLIDDGTGATIENNTIIAREGGLALQVKQAPSSGVTAIETNTFQSLGNETAESLVVIGSNGSGSTTASIVMTDGGEPMSLETQTNQPQASDQPSVQVVDNAFIGNISGQGAVVVESESDIEVAAEQNDFSEALLFDDDADLVSNQSTAASVTTSGNIEPEPVSQGEGIDIPGDKDVRTADITGDGNLPNLTPQDVAVSLNPQQNSSQNQEADGFFMGAYVPTVVDGDTEIPVEAGNRGVTVDTTASENAAIAIPDSVDDPGDVDEFFSNDPAYVATIPVEIVWNSTLSNEEFDEIAFNINDTTGSGSNADLVGKSFLLNEPRGRTQVDIPIGYEGLSGTAPGSTNFRDGGFELVVDFLDSDLSELASTSSLSSAIEYATPNNSVLEVGDVVSQASTVYNEGLSLAEEVTKLPDNSVDTLRQSARLALYTQVAASSRELAESELVQGATVNGLSAFADEAADVADFNQSEAFNASDEVAPAGPTVGFLTESEAESDPQTIQVENTQFRGDDRSCGVFQFTPTGGNLAVPVTIGDGAILSTGKVNDIVGPNSSSSNATQTAGGSDSDLEDLPTIENDTFDRASLEFDLAVPSDVTEISFRYVFGSEEYNEFTGTGFNDVFAFFVNGENVATVPDPNNPGGRIPASINNVNHGQQGATQETNPQLFINNDPHDGEVVTVDPQNPPGPGIGFDPSNTSPGEEPFPFEMDGFTVPLEITAPVNPGETNNIKIAIADVGDAIFDSWVIVAASDITATGGSNTS